MSTEHDRLYDLLPGIIRQRDFERGEPLRGLLAVIAEQAAQTEEETRRFYENCFVETCDPALLPYIGDLVGYHPLAQPPAAAGWTVPRREVADTIQFRRRKGTVDVLNDLARAASGWPACATEVAGKPEVAVRVWRLRSFPLTRTRPYYVPRRVNCFTFRVLGNDAPLYTGTARPGSPTSECDPPQPLTIKMLNERREEFYGDGRSLCIYENGRPVAASRLDVRDLSEWGGEVFDDQVAVDPESGRLMYPEVAPRRLITTSTYYGFAAEIGGGEYPRPPRARLGAISLFRRGHLREGGVPFLAQLQDGSPFSADLRRLLALEVRLDEAQSAEDLEQLLADALNRVLQAHALADAAIGELALDDEALDLLESDPEGSQRIRLNRLILEAAFPDAIARSYAIETVVAAADERVIMDTIRRHQAGPRPALHLVVELADSGLYVEPVIVAVAAGHTLELRAADGCRPTLLLPERSADIDDMIVTCADASRLILDGLLVVRRPVRVIGQPEEVVIRDCTLVPGWELDADCTPCCGDEPSLILSDYAVDASEAGCAAPIGTPPLSPCIRIERSILGSIQVQRDEVLRDPLRLWLADSIVDATSRSLAALSAPNNRLAHATLSIARCTIIGATLVHAIELGEDTIFDGKMGVGRRQIGCLRFCALADTSSSTTPRRYRCQDLPTMEKDSVEQGVDATDAKDIAHPPFVCVRYGKPRYCQLDRTESEIVIGASDESEIGVYHHLYWPQREANLRARLCEFMPTGWKAKFIPESE